MFGAATGFGSSAIAAGFAAPGLIPKTNPVVMVKQHHNGNGGNWNGGEGKHHHQGSYNDDGDHHHCKGKSCNDNAGGSDDINSQSSTSNPGKADSNVLWGDYLYVNPSQ
jgi:hypothetical protein